MSVTGTCQSCGMPLGRDAVMLRGRGTFEVEGEPPPGYPLVFRSGVVETMAVLDLAEGTLLAAEEKGRLDFVLRSDGRTPTHWAWNRRMASVGDGGKISK